MATSTNWWDQLPGANAGNTPGFTLPSRDTVMGNIGFLPSGGSSRSGFDGGINWGDLAQGALPLLLSAFGPSNQYRQPTEDLAKELQALSEGIGTQGKKTAAQGSEALSSVLKYFKDLAGGDQAAVLEATAPERGRIIDQYDTAKKSVQTLPRGGGQATGILNLEQGKARDIANLSLGAREKGTTGLTQVGSTLLSAGTQQQAVGLSGMEGALRAFEQLSHDKTASQADFGKAIGSILASFIPGGSIFTSIFK